MNPAEDYIINQKEPFRSILLHLKAVIESVVPQVDMKYKWNIPCFYAGKQPICYLNVSPKKTLCGHRILELGPFDPAFGQNGHGEPKSGQIPTVHHLGRN